MVARTCKKCKKLFNSISRDICPVCSEKEKTGFKLVEGYLREHPGAALLQICEDTGLDESLVLSFIREGKLKGVTGVENLKCESCGKPINGGRMCQTCMAKFSINLEKVAAEKDRETDTIRKGMISKRKPEDDKKV